MIYLFNSAARELYKKNVLNTLLLPIGFENEFRYTFQNGHNYVDDKILRNEYKFKKEESKKIMIVFIDRDHPSGYYFYPFRMAKYLSHRTEGNQVLFKVQLEEYIFPKNIQQFNDTFKQRFLTTGLPQKSVTDPALSSDGYFALTGDSVIAANDLFTGDKAWVNFIDAAALCNAFGNNSTMSTIFPKLTVYKDDNFTKPLKPTRKKNSSFLKLRKNSRYTLKYSYRFPIKNTHNQASADFEIDLPNDIILESAKKVNINNSANTEEIRIKTKRIVENDSGSIDFKYNNLSPESLQNPLLSPIKAISYRISDPKLFWLYSTALVILYSIFTVLGTIDFSKFTVVATNNPSLFRELYNYLIPICQSLSLLIKFVAGILQVITLLFIIKIYGKKIF
jgi:hypothetical protein